MYKHHEDFESIQVRKGSRARFRKLKDKLKYPLYVMYQEAMDEYLEKKEAKNG